MVNLTGGQARCEVLTQKSKEHRNYLMLFLSLSGFLQNVLYRWSEFDCEAEGSDDAIKGRNFWFCATSLNA